jgi:hypothetical protein
MKKTLMISFVLSFGLFICSCTGNFGDLFGTSNNTKSADSSFCHHHHGNDHDADDSTATGDTAARIHLTHNTH